MHHSDVFNFWSGKSAKKYLQENVAKKEQDHGFAQFMTNGIIYLYNIIKSKLKANLKLMLFILK